MYQKRFRVDVNRGIFQPFRSKKGQITLFIIIGILILLAVILVIALKTELVKFKPGELIPTEKGKVENFLTACIEQVGNDALFRIGLQGGYLDIPPNIATDGNLHLRLSPMNVVPYWAYGQNLGIPSLERIKEDIDNHLKANLRQCLFGNEAFQETYDLIEKSSISPNTAILDNKIQFDVNWNIEVRNKEGEVISEIADHRAESQVKLKKLYELGRRITEKELEVFKVEDITQDLIALEHPDVPLTGIDISCFQKEWDVAPVKTAVQNLLHTNIPQIKIKGTDFVEFPEELTYYQNHYIWDIGEGYENDNINVQFRYDQNYPFYFQVTPLSGTKMKSSQLGGSSYLPILCVQTWKFTYDIVYPVLVQLRDETTGYVFNIAFTVHLLRNAPNRGDVQARPSYFVEKPTDEDYCKRSNTPMTIYTYELVENNDTGVYIREPLEGVQTSFTCLRYRCDIGETRYGFANRGDVAGLTSNFPYCIGGILRGEKEGYQENWVRIVSKPGEEIELDLTPLFSYPVQRIKVLKHELSAANTPGLGKTVGRNEVAFIKITSLQKKTDSSEPLHEVSLVHSPLIDQRTAANETTTFLAKANFEYHVEINILDEEKLVGGYVGNWTVPWDVLKNSREITFHTVSKETSSDEEMYNLFLGLEQNSKFVPAPEIK